MKMNCPRSLAALRSVSPDFHGPQGPDPHRVVRNGYFYRKSDSRWIARFHCRSCRYHFSAATDHPCFGQKRRRLNHPAFLLFCSGVSQRRVARLLGVNRKTAVRKFRFLAGKAKLEQEKFLRSYPVKSCERIQWDDLETSEHSKCKPLSIALAVDEKTRKILGFEVSQMPARGPLAPLARRKYGYRKDERAQGWERLMKTLEPLVLDRATITSDQNPHYPQVVRRHFPLAKHVTVKGRRGCIAGQGELKKIGFDPLFSLNHTCAMLRANLNRLFRRTWCTTKKRQGLIDHLHLYVIYHNTVLTERSAA